LQTGLIAQPGRSSSRLQRHLLLDLDICPIGCLDEYCAEGATTGGLRCLKCADTLVVDRITGLCGGSSCWVCKLRLHTSGPMAVR
jgi:hypothetical protein